MKRLLWAVFFVFFIPFLSFADEMDKALPTNTPSKVKESARQVVQLGVEPDSIIKMTQSMISADFSEQQIVAVHELLIKVTKQHLDEKPIINKLYEGIAKKVKPETILQVMEINRDRYEFANAYTQNMKIDEDKAKVVAKIVADCRAANMDITSMNKIKEMLQTKTRNAPKSQAFDLIDKTLNTARTMAREGVGSKDIVDVMNNAFKRNYNAGQMEKLGNIFMMQAKGMSSAPDLAKAYSSAIKDGATPDNFGAFNNQSMPPSGGRPPVGAPPPNSGIAAGSGSPPSKSIAGSAPAGDLGPASAGGPGASAPPPAGAPPGPARGAPSK
jgi:hypothetical protein